MTEADLRGALKAMRDAGCMSCRMIVKNAAGEVDISATFAPEVMPMDSMGPTMPGAWKHSPMDTADDVMPYRERQTLPFADPGPVFELPPEG